MHYHRKEGLVAVDNAWRPAILAKMERQRSSVSPVPKPRDHANSQRSAKTTLIREITTSNHIFITALKIGLVQHNLRHRSYHISY